MEERSKIGGQTLLVLTMVNYDKMERYFDHCCKLYVVIEFFANSEGKIGHYFLLLYC